MKPRACLTLLVSLALASAVTTAVAQGNETGSEPTLSESDFNTEPPQEDDSYLDDEYDSTSSGDASTDSDVNTTGDEPTLTESDFDTNAPSFDESWLDDESDLAGTGAEDADTASTGSPTPTEGASAKNRTPGPGVVGAIAALAGLALGMRGPSRPKA